MSEFFSLNPNTEPKPFNMVSNANINGPAAGGADPASWWDSFQNFMVGKTNKDTGTNPGGMGMGLLTAGSSLLNGYNGFQNMKLAKDTLNFQKDAFSKQFENQRTLINNEIQDRNDARISRDSAYKPTMQTV